MPELYAPDIEWWVNENFQLIKSLGIFLSILLVAAFQSLFPNRLALQKVFRNWRINMPLAGVNALLLSLLCGACVCAWALTVRDLKIGFYELAGFPYWLEVAFTVILLDFVAWIWHIANHKWRLLWRFHSVHHSDETFEASTGFRFHPGELLISLGVRLLVVTATGLPLLGLILFEVIFGAFNLFVHSDLRLPPKAELILSWAVVTPSLHRMHHSASPEEHNRNFGTIFSFWDRIARTFLYADSRSRVEVGLSGLNRSSLSFRGVLTMPFDDASGRSSNNRRKSDKR
ncbi:MAG TPA: sterol desaturase family protein [Acidobacteriota bacterium]|nr:sterol desaturase family protein [Acidobacteriota bacterium]